MIRTHLVKALYEKLLGPEYGPYEVVEFPFTKYVTGHLSTSFVPEKPGNPANDGNNPGVRNDPSYAAGTVLPAGANSEESSSSEELDQSFQESALDPRKGSKSMGVSFAVSDEQSGTPKISICCTWARYELKEGYDRYDHAIFERKPNFYIINEIEVDGKDKEIPLSGFSETKHVTLDGPILHVKQRKTRDRENTWIVSVFLENQTKFNPEVDGREWEIHRIFQPQIRIKCSPGTKTEFFEHSVVPEPDSVEAKDMLGYMNNSSKARGHQCGAVWKEVDPEMKLDGFAKFTWVDAAQEKFSQSAKEDFTQPDVRTDYFPSYTILQPDMSDKPEFEAEKLADMWDPDEFRNDEQNGLEQIYNNYKQWIEKREKELQEDDMYLQLDDNLRITAETNLGLCRASLLRIKKGMDFICEDSKARLAFCFMNKVMHTKMDWDMRNDKSWKGLKWREFQMAFMLQSLRGVTGIDKEDAEKCDVLWFPTGGGKTEAYLGLSMFILAYRRLSRDEEFENDGGVTVFSRYTLRLLTIQQFSRSLGSIVAADFVRVKNWKPKKLSSFEEPDLTERYHNGTLWGRSRISIGLWIGGGITPNTVPIHRHFGNSTPNAVGALAPQLLSNPDRTSKAGEPAQISICPCCKNILATTSVKPEEPATLIWLIKTTKSLESLNTLTVDDLTSRNHPIKIEDVEFLPDQNISSKDDGYKLLKAKITVLGEEATVDNKINKWWMEVVEDKITSSDSSALLSTCASRPGYFFRYHNGKPFDFSIHCINPYDCELNKPGTKWFESQIDNMKAGVAEPFLDPQDSHYSSSIPISAFTVDPQIYLKCPSFLLATADKFARLPFKQESASIFGNVNVFHKIFGYGRDGTSNIPRSEIFRTPLDDSEAKSRRPIKLESGDFTPVKPFSPPNLIIQDELHLIEGPLGSMVGIYEMAVDILCSNKKQTPKYIASSATIKESESQVGSVYRRKINIFPQPAISSNDTYFSRLEDDLSSVQNKAGRLYLGVCAGVGTYIIPVKIWAVLLSKIFRIRNDARNPKYGLVDEFEKQKIQKDGIQSFEDFIDKKTDLYWTLVGYFSDLQLLARTSTMYNQDIYRDVTKFSQDVLENVNTSSRGIGSKRPKAIMFYPFSPPRQFTASYISVLCQDDGGKISTAIFDDDNGKPGSIISRPNKDSLIQTCSKGENIFLLNEKLTLTAGKQIWLSVMSDSDNCYFQDGTKKVECFVSSSFKQVEQNGKQVDDIGNFSDSKLSMKKLTDLPIRIFLKSDNRELDVGRRIEMSSRTDSTELPVILEKLSRTEDNKVDALLTTPIFGTGIDITRLGLMVVMNQPKTTSQYIQATGRVGRNDPGLVVSWLKMGRYRDLNHYENFVGYHSAIHRYVEPITASPFSEKTMKNYLGPVIVAALRVGRKLGLDEIPLEWVPTKNGNMILKNRNNSETDSLYSLMEDIACSKNIPEIRRLDKSYFYEYFNMALKKWEVAAKHAEKGNSYLAYYDYSYMHSQEIKNDVVLGSPQHKIQKKKIAFQNVRSSLREIEAQSGMGEELVE